MVEGQRAEKGWKKKTSPWKSWTGYTCRTGASVLSEPRDLSAAFPSRPLEVPPPNGATDGAAFVVEMWRARLVSHLLVLQHSSTCG